MAPCRLVLVQQKMRACVTHRLRCQVHTGISCYTCTHLLNILLKDTQLQTLVQANFAVLPDVLQLPLVMQYFMDDVQNMVDSLGVVC